MTKEEFADWKNHPVTKVVMASLAGKIQEVSDDLSQTAGRNPLEDRYKVGAIAGYRDLTLIDWEDTK